MGVMETKNQVEYAGMRLTSHMETVDSANSRLTWSFIIETGLVAGVGAAQMMIVKALFEKKRSF